MDRGLIERARGGDRAAFERIATEISDGLYSLAARILRDPEAAGDALQATLVRIWRDLPTLRDPDRFEAWAHRVLVNRCYQHVRTEHRRPRIVSISVSDGIVADAQLALGTRDELERAFERLSVEHRTVVVMHYLRDLPQDEIAAWLGISPGTVKSRLHHARRALRAAIEADSRPARPEGRTA